MHPPEPVSAPPNPSTSALEPPPAALKEWLKVCADAIGLMVKMALGLGVLVTLGYCWLVIGYFPVGITIGDSLFFFAVAFAYGVVHLATWGLLPAIATDGLFRLLAVFWPKLRDVASYPPVVENKLPRIDILVTIGMGSLSLLLLSLSAVLVWATSEWWAGAAFVVSGLLLWVIGVLLRSPKANSADRRKGTAAFAAVALVLMPVSLGQALVRWQIELVMNSYALRIQNVTLRLSDENHATLHAAAQSWRLPLPYCAALSGPGSHVVQGVNLVWHGLGERSLARLADPQRGGEGVMVELQRDGLFAIRGPGRHPATCPQIATPAQPG